MKRKRLTRSPTAPDLSEKTIWYYKTAFMVDQHASINMAAARQRHVDQGQSFNLYVRPDIKHRIPGTASTRMESCMKSTY